MVFSISFDNIVLECVRTPTIVFGLREITDSERMYYCDTVHLVNGASGEKLFTPTSRRAKRDNREKNKELRISSPNEKH